MQKVWIALSILFLVVLGAVVFKQKIGDIRPAILPSRNTIRSIVSQNKKPIESNVDLSVPQGFAIRAFAQNIDGARDLQFSPHGTLLVSQPSSGVVSALPDKNNDGVSDTAKTVLSGLKRPHGLAFSGNHLFVAEENKVVRYVWDEKNLTATFDKKLFDLPSGGRHFSRTIAIEKDGTMYVSLGSTCDTCFEKHPFIGAVIISTTEGKKPEVFARGLRNAVFIKLDKQEKLWGTEMGRDFLGDNLPPDEVNMLTKGGDYGWPVCYGNRVYDRQFGQRNPSYCENTVPALFNLPAHTAPLGLTFIDSDHFSSDWQGDLLVSLHGSWNSSVPVGYKVVRLHIEGSRVTGVEDFVTGFIRDGQVANRPVDVEFGPQGDLYISDDKGGMIYRVVGSN